jgi:hypothetical protein
MSQSDYIKYKKMSQELKINKLPPVLEPDDYISYKEYALENSIKNTKLTYNQLQPPNKIMVMNMEKTVTNCPSFIVCKNTHLRPHRATYPPTYASQYATVHPIRPFTHKQQEQIQQKKYLSLPNTKLCLCSNL